MYSYYFPCMWEKAKQPRYVLDMYGGIIIIQFRRLVTSSATAIRLRLRRPTCLIRVVLVALLEACRWPLVILVELSEPVVVALIQRSRLVARCFVQISLRLLAGTDMHLATWKRLATRRGDAAFASVLCERRVRVAAGSTIKFVRNVAEIACMRRWRGAWRLWR